MARKVSLRLILVLPFVVQIFAAVGLTGWVSLRNGQKAVNDLANQLMDKNHRLVEQYLEHYLSTPKQLNQNHLNAIALGYLKIQNLESTGHFYWRQLQTFNVTYIGTTLASGEFIGAGYWLHGNGNSVDIEEVSAKSKTLGKSYVWKTDKKGNRQKVVEVYDYKPLEESCYRETVEAGKSIWCSVYVWGKNKNYLAVATATPVYNHHKQLIGVIGVDFLLREICDFLQSMKISPSGEVFILEPNGLLIASSSSKKSSAVDANGKRIHALNSSDRLIQTTAKQLQQEFGSFSKIKDSEKFSFKLNGENQFAQVSAWRDKLGLNWLVVLVVPESDFMQAINTNTHMTVLLCLLALTVAIAAGLVTSRWLVQPILETISAAESLSQGNWQTQVPESCSRELALLAKAFNRMAGQLQASFVELEYNAYHDSLTGLPNRSWFSLKLQEAIERGRHHTNANKKESPYLFAVLFLDIDYFKIVNDSLGHLIGDQLLIAVAERLKESIAASGAVARFGGDEFVILLAPISDAADATQVADRILLEFQRPFHLQDSAVFVTTSIGIVLSTTNSKESESFLRDADTAMYRAKANGRAGYELFDATMHAETVMRLQLETDLRRAIEREEFKVYYQPIIDLKTHDICGVEALLRWDHPTKGLVSPAEFIPIAEETGLISQIGWWVLRQACQQMMIWRQQFDRCQTMTMSVNLSGRQFFQSDSLAQIERIILETGINRHDLKLEITESMLMNNTETIVNKFRRLKELGIKLSIDDFGTGYSALSYLHRFPLNTLKIDRSFINRIGANGENLEIVEAITVMAHKLGMDVVAEGVETKEQLEQLRAIGCERVQGYLFSPPLTAIRLEELLVGDQCSQKIR